MMEMEEMPVTGMTGAKDESVKRLIKASHSGQQGTKNIYADIYEGRLIFDHAAGRWYVFDEHVWKKDLLQEHIEACRRVQELYDEGAYVLQSEIDSAIKLALGMDKIPSDSEMSDTQKAATREITGKFSKHAKGIASLKRASRNLDTLSYRKQITEFAGVGIDGLSLTGSEWDRDGWLLGCPNGIVDLKAGEIRDGMPEDYISCSIDTLYQKDAKCPKFETFVSEIMDGDPEMVGFLQRVLGMSLIGDAAFKEYIVLLTGTGRNGKDTLLKIINRVLGDEIAGRVDSSLFIGNNKFANPDAASPAIAGLRGKRLVYASEPEKKDGFSLGKVKELSGGGDLSARVPYGREIIQFRASHLIFLMANHNPDVDANDLAFWYRVICVPFKLSFVPNPRLNYERKEKKGLVDDILDEKEGILNWLIQGCLEYQRIGLSEPEQVREAREIYKEEVDILGAFLADRCVKVVDGKVQASALFSQYKAWCALNGYVPVSLTRFGEDVGKRFTRKKEASGIFYEGVNLK